MSRCSNCGRKVRNPIIAGGFSLGPVCARKLGAVLSKPRRRRAAESRAVAQDDGQADLFGGAE